MTTLLVASGGGHLQQLASIVPRLNLGPDIVWVTPRTALSDHLLRDAQHIEIPYTAPRDWRAAIRMTSIARGVIREVGADRIISTGASPAPPFFLVGASQGLDLHYIESATRSEGPSLSGKLIAMLPTAHLYTQYPDLATGRWRFAGSIFDPYTTSPAPRAPQGIRQVVVTLGTEIYGFRRALERLLGIVPRDAEVLWQTGHTNIEGLGIEGHESIAGGDLRSAIAAADVVISHAGTGSALTALDAGKVPLILPREARFGEHVDNHQFQTARELTRRGLAVSVPVADLTLDHLREAQATEVQRAPALFPFALDGQGHGSRQGTPVPVDLREPVGFGTSMAQGLRLAAHRHRVDTPHGRR